MAENFGIGFVIGASLASSVGGAFASLDQKIKGASSRLADLGTRQKHLSSLAALRREAGELQTILAASGGKNAIVGEALQSVLAKYQKAKVEAKQYGIEVKDYAKAHSLAAAEIKRTEAALARYTKRQANRERRTELGAQIRDSLVPLSSLVVPVKLAMDFESSMADVKKVTNFDDAGFAALSKNILNMSTRLPMAASGLAQIAAAAGAAGIAEADLLAFTEDAAKMGVEFDVSAAEAGAAMTGLRNNFKLSQDEVRLLGDAMNALSNSMDAKAAQIVDFANRAGGTAKIYGMTGQEVSALGAAFLDAKVGAEEASTATNSMLTRLGTADKLPKDAQEAFASLGISGKGLAKAFQEDAQGALLNFLRTVSKSKDPMRALSAIFGAEHAPKIAKLMGNLERYEEGLDTVSNAEKYAGSTNEEYATRAETTANNMQLLKNSIAKLGITIGNVLLPPLNWALGILTPGINAITEFASKNEWLTASIAGLGAGFITISTLGMACAYVGTYLSSGWAVFTGILSALHPTALLTNAILLKQRVCTLASAAGTMVMAGATKVAAVSTKIMAGAARVAAAGQWVLNAAMLANPIGLVVAGIAALGGWFAWCYNCAGSFTGALGLMWEQFKNVLPIMHVVESAVTGTVQFITDLWNGMSLYDAGVKLMGTLGDGIKSMWTTVTKPFVAIGDFFDFGDAESDPEQGVPGTATAGQGSNPAAVTPKSTWYNPLSWFGSDEEPETPSSTAVKDIPASVAAKATTPPTQAQPVRREQTETPAGQVAVKPTEHAAVKPLLRSEPENKPGKPTQQEASASLPAGRSPSPAQGVASGPMSGPMPGTPGLTVRFDFSLNGMPDTVFAQGVINALRERASDVESLISGIVNNQARVAYGR